MIKWKLKQVMVDKGLWTGQELLDLLENKAGIIVSHTTVMQLIKQQPKAIRLQTLEALCVALDCSPWDLIEYKPSQIKSIGNVQAVGGTGEAIRPYARKSRSKAEPIEKTLYPEENY